MQLRRWILAVSIVSSICIAHAESVVNGSFEEGAFTPPSNATMSLAPGAAQLQGWEVIGDWIAWIGVGNPFGLSASDGNRLLDLTEHSDGPPFGGIRQTIVTVPGTEYVLSLYLGSSTRWGRPSAVTVSAGGSVETFSSPLAGTDSDWNLHRLQFTASEALTTISIVGADGNAYIGLDAVSVKALGEGVVVADKEWRQLTETVRFTWDEAAAACPLDGTTPCSGLIVRASDGTSVDVSGWTWARSSEVRALWDAIIAPSTTDFETDTDAYSKVDDPDIHLALSGEPGWFNRTRTDAAGDYLYGLTATADGENAYRPHIRDAIPAHADTVTLGTVLPQTGRQSYTGIWLFRPHGAGHELTSLTLRSELVVGCKSVTGTVTLPGPAPAGGVVVTLSDTLSAASTPVTLKFLEGATSKTFTVKTVPVAENQTGKVSATLGSTTLSQPLTVRPMGLTSVTLTPISVVGSQPVVGKATLECKAGPGPITVDLSSNNPAVASPVAVSIVVPQSLQSVNFAVTTNAVPAKSYATVSGTANGVTKSKRLTVNVVAAVSPTSLRFGNVPVGTTSGMLNATLMNKGAAAFSINSITLTGTGATYFAKSSNCGATLAAGASCTIGVTFKPTTTFSKSAKISIATSATTRPLSVTLSGKGI